MDSHKKIKRAKGKAIYFRVKAETYKSLERVAKARKRRTVPDLLYAQALELADTAEARHG